MTMGNTDLSAMRADKLTRHERDLSEHERRERTLERRRAYIARARAEHAAAFARPLISHDLLTPAERKQIRARIRHAQPWSELEGLQEFG
jgi:hypothetical protein